MECPALRRGRRHAAVAQPAAELAGRGLAGPADRRAARRLRRPHPRGALGHRQRRGPAAAPHPRHHAQVLNHCSALQKLIIFVDLHDQIHGDLHQPGDRSRVLGPPATPPVSRGIYPGRYFIKLNEQIHLCGNCKINSTVY